MKQSIFSVSFTILVFMTLFGIVRPEMASAVSYSILPTVVHASRFGIPEVAGKDVEAVTPPEPKIVNSPSPNTLHISWGAPDNRYITADVSNTIYSVEVYTKKGDFFSAVTTPATSTLIQGLQANKVYRIHLIAHRNSVQSDIVEFSARTIPAAPKLSAATVEKHTSAQNNDSAQYLTQLSWQKPSGTVRYYTLSVYDRAENNLVYTEKVNKPQALLDQLNPGKYYFTVVANFNSNYRSLASNPQKFEVKE